MIVTSQDQQDSPFIIACKENRLEIVKRYLEIQPNLWKTYTYTGETPLHLSAAHGALEVFQYLVQHIQKQTGKTAREVVSVIELENAPFYAACTNNQLAIVKYSLGIAPDLWKGHGGMHYAAENGSLEVFQYLVQHIQRQTRKTAREIILKVFLHIACTNNQLAIVKYSLSIGADLWENCNRDGSPLHTAAESGALEIFNHFIVYSLKFTDKTAQEIINFSYENGDTPFHYACKANKRIIVERCLEIDADLWKKPNKKNQYPIHMAIAADNIDVMVYLLNKIGIDLFKQYSSDIKEGNLLHYALSQGKLEHALYLLKWLSSSNNRHLIARNEMLQICNQKDGTSKIPLAYALEYRKNNKNYDKQIDEIIDLLITEPGYDKASFFNVKNLLNEDDINHVVSIKENNTIRKIGTLETRQFRLIALLGTFKSKSPNPYHLPSNAVKEIGQFLGEFGGLTQEKIESIGNRTFFGTSDQKRKIDLSDPQAVVSEEKKRNQINLD